MSGWDPADATTLVHLLAGRAAHTPNHVAVAFGGRERTYAALWADVERFAAVLASHGLAAGDPVVIVMPNGLDFFTAFYAAQRVGGIAVPIFAGVSATRVAEMAALCGARLAVVPIDALGHPGPTTIEGPGTPLAVLTVDSRPGARSDSPVAVEELKPDDVAFLQYTSGSTGDPKGVMLTHRGLLTNVQQMIAGMALTAEDRFVSWLPCYHDMGLILMTMAPLYLDARLFLLPTSLRDTRPWLAEITEQGGTFTASPDFGYRLCLRQPDPSIYDLSSLRVALNAAEPVRPATIEAFHDTFGLRDVMVAGYGLAEATVGVSMWPAGTPNRIDDDGVVSVGPPFPDVEVRVLDDDDQPLPAGVHGHLVVASPATTPGYWNNSSATADLFTKDRAIRTGDIGYIDGDGNAYILSRAKDVVITAGRSVYPQEVEEIAARVRGVRYAAAIGVDRGRVEGEQLVVVVEIRPDDLPTAAERKDCVIAVTDGVAERFGFRPARVQLVAPRTIPLTHNGKLRRSALVHRYLQDGLGNAVLYPPVPG